MSTPKLTKVVRIRDGEVLEAVLDDSLGVPWTKVWSPTQLKKDGGFPLNQRCKGTLQEEGRFQLGAFALYDTELEAKAQPVRDQIKRLGLLLEDAEHRLMVLYQDSIRPQTEKEA